jgi:hypothetical protein
MTAALAFSLPWGGAWHFSDIDQMQFSQNAYANELAGNEKLSPQGEVMGTQGYDTFYIYGGYGYFDNMNAHFADDNYQGIDRTNFPKESVFNQDGEIQEAIASYQAADQNFKRGALKFR